MKGVVIVYTLLLEGFVNNANGLGHNLDEAVFKVHTVI